MVTDRNREFQSEEPKIHSIYQKMENLFCSIVSIYVKEDYVDRTEVSMIEFKMVTDENKFNSEKITDIELDLVVESNLRCLP